MFGTVAFLHLIDKNSALFLSGGYRHTGESDFGCRYGSSLLANMAYEPRLGKTVDGVVELNDRHAKEDRIDAAGGLDESTGGSLLYLTPKLLVSLCKGLVVRFAAQVPVAHSLN